jgi:hypothetical protein
LLKALYGSKQAGRAWYETLTKYLISTGYTQIPSDPCVIMFSKSLPTNEYLFVCIHVDDLLIVGTPKPIATFKQHMIDRLKMKDLGSSDIFVKFTGYEIHRSRENRAIFLTQTQYTKDILERFGFSLITPRTTPADPKVDLAVRFLPPPTPDEIRECNCCVIRNILLFQIEN